MSSIAEPLQRMVFPELTRRLSQIDIFVDYSSTLALTHQPDCGFAFEQWITICKNAFPCSCGLSFYLRMLPK